MSKIQVNEIVNHFDNGAPDCPRGLTIAGVATAATLDVTGNVSVGGTLTYDDVTNIDSVGIITAQNGINVSGGTLVVAGFSTYTGIATFNNNVKVGSKITLNAAAGSATILGSVDGIESSISNGTVSTTIKDGNTQDLYRGIKGSTTVFNVGYDGGINAKANADFGGRVVANGQAHISDDNNDIISGYNAAGGATPTFKVTGGGAVTAAGTLNTGDLSATGGGNRVTADGQIFIRPADSKIATASAIQIYSGGDSGSDATITFKKNGDSEFTGIHDVGDASGTTGYVRSRPEGIVYIRPDDSAASSSIALQLFSGGNASSNSVFKITKGGEVTATGDLIAAGALLRSTSTSDGPVLQFDGAGPNGTNYIFGKIEGNNTGSNNAGELRFYTNLASAGGLSQRMLITREGNVGIGTDNPAVISGMSKYLTLSAKAADNAVGLELQGNRTGSNQTVGRISFVNNANEIVRITADSAAGGSTGNLTFTTSGTERVRITSAGLVGIGTDQPVQTLEVHSGPTANGVSLDTTYTGGPNIAFKVQGTIKSYIGSPTGFGAGDGDDLGLRATDNVIIHAGGGTERMRIDSSGRLLLGTSSTIGAPRLDVVGNSASATGEGIVQIRRGESVTSNDQTIGALNFGDTTSGGFRRAQIVAASDSAGGAGDLPTRLVFTTTADSEATPAERMRIDNGGDVHIGNTTSSAHSNRLLAVGDVSRSATYIECRTSTSGDGGYLFSDGTGGTDEGYRGSMEYSHSNDTLFFKTAGTNRMTLSSTGALLVPGVYSGTTSTAANVVVEPDGTIRRSTSSIKYKNNVTTLTDTLADKILECRAVSYTSKCDGDDNTKINYGLIAEEVYDVDPSLVFTDNGEPEGVQYDRFVPHLVNLVKRQKTQIETLEQRLTDAGL